MGAARDSRKNTGEKQENQVSSSSPMEPVTPLPCNVTLLQAPWQSTKVDKVRESGTSVHPEINMQ